MNDRDRRLQADEILYRRILPQVDYLKDDGGTWRATSAAFGDRKQQPSFDRKILLNDSYSNTRDGIAEIRVLDAENDALEVFAYNDPKPDNPAHAILDASRLSRSQFARLRRSLAMKSTLVRMPDGPLTP